MGDWKIGQVETPGWFGRINTKSGSGFHPLAPVLEEVHLSDIAYGLAYRYRYACQTTPYSVAEHSLLVRSIIKLSGGGPQLQLAGLLHDASEAYTHDLPSPIRKFVSVTLPSGEVVPWTEMERRIALVIERKFDMEPDIVEAREVRVADMLAVVIEKAQIPELQSEGDWGLPPLPPELSDLKVEFLTPERSITEFMFAYESLRAELTLASQG